MTAGCYKNYSTTDDEGDDDSASSSLSWFSWFNVIFVLFHVAWFIAGKLISYVYNYYSIGQPCHNQNYSTKAELQSILWNVLQR